MRLAEISTGGRAEPTGAAWASRWTTASRCATRAVMGVELPYV